MTEQIPDVLWYKGEDYAIMGASGKGLYTAADFKMKTYSTFTACWRGYVMEYHCIDGQLILQTMRINTKKPKKVLGIQPTSCFGNFKFCYSLGLITKFTGAILIGKDLIEKRNASIMILPRSMNYQTVLRLHFKKGKLMAENIVSNKKEAPQREFPFEGTQPKFKPFSDAYSKPPQKEDSH